MKQVTYQINGIVDDAMREALSLSCASVRGVTQASLSVTDGRDTQLTLSMADDPTENQERMLASVFDAKGLELLLDTRHIEEIGAPAPSTGEPAQTEPAIQNGQPADRYVTAPLPKPEKKVGLSAAIGTVITAVVLAVLLTFSVTRAYIKSDAPTSTVPPGLGGSETTADGVTTFDALTILDRVFRDYTVTELGEDFPTAILKSYVAATGDIYAEYLTPAEVEELTSNQNGEMCGIGVTVVNDACTVGGMKYPAIIVVNVYPDSPAAAAGVLPGDAIMFVGAGEDQVSVSEIGYTAALNRMKGEEGTTCEFTAYRFKPDGESYDTVDISAVRQKIQVQTVIGRIYKPDPGVGIVKITGFDNTTYPQFVAAIEELKEAGCTAFVLDLRNNPGGLLTAVEDVLTLFLQEGDIMISTRDNKDRETVTRLKLDAQGNVLTGTGSMSDAQRPYPRLTAADVGKYRNLNFSVLVNGYSASAAELFTANMQDYELATVVGTKTFGKGSMQRTIDLSWYGYEGALKLTTAYYYPPSGEGYHGLGIMPHEGYEVALSEEIRHININLLTDEQDNQLAAAAKAATAERP